MDLETRIDELWEEGRVEAEPIEEAIELLDRGELRAAEPGPDGWVVNELPVICSIWLMRASRSGSLAKVAAASTFLLKTARMAASCPPA